MSLISIIIPVYNCVEYLERCVNSVLSQSYPDVEILLVNDGSVDGSKELCDTLGHENDNVRVFHTVNSGVSSARNTALENCQGEFITCVDADDMLAINAIQAMVEGARHSQADIVIGSFAKVTPQDEIIETVGDIAEDVIYSMEDVVEYTWEYLKNPRKHQLLMSCWAKLFKKSIIRENDIWFDTSLDLAEDVAFNFEYLKHINKALFIKDVVYHHQKTGSYNSLSMKMPDNPGKLFVGPTVLHSIKGFLYNYDPTLNTRHDLGHYYVYQAALFMVRLCGQINIKNERKLQSFVSELVNDAEFRSYIKYYVPAEGNYRLIPWLMKYRLTRLLIRVCKHEAEKLYTHNK